MSQHAARSCPLTQLNAVFFVVALSGCGGLDFELPDFEKIVEDGVSKSVHGSTMARPGESSSMMLPTGAALAVPDGAVSEAVEITMERPGKTQALELVDSLPRGYRYASVPYVLTPHGLHFERAVAFKMPVATKGASQLVALYLDDEGDKTWKTYGVPEVSGETATLQLSHFSVWLVVERMASCKVDADDDLDEALDEGDCDGDDDDDGGEGGRGEVSYGDDDHGDDDYRDDEDRDDDHRGDGSTPTDREPYMSSGSGDADGPASEPTPSR